MLKGRGRVVDDREFRLLAKRAEKHQQGEQGRERAGGLRRPHRSPQPADDRRKSGFLRHLKRERVQTNGSTRSGSVQPRVEASKEEL